ncbi:hypothetical protein [Burkholderia cepacia]|uniref:hypothetical protein n=1 Tax=Burkholderia cepacia TaxID=292 RepID=UPI002ABE962D|nr:hypothetical protein [Burkholderia cepacia]
MALNLAKLILEFLKGNPDRKFTARQIAEWIFAAHPEECHAKKLSSQNIDTDAKLIQQLVAEIGAYRPRIQKRNPELIVCEP